MTEKFKKREYILIVVFFVIPVISFTWVTLDDKVLQTMIDNHYTKPMFGFVTAWFWFGLTSIAMMIDKIYEKMKEKRMKVEINDPSLAFGFYLFDKKRV